MGGMKRYLLSVSALAVILLVGVSSASAQERHYTVGLYGNSGISMGTGQGDTVILRSPLAGELTVRTWTDIDPELVFSMGVRMEVENTTALAIVPRVEYMKVAAHWFRVRPFAGLPLFFMPFSMLGIEGGFSLDFHFGDFSIVLSAVVDAFIWGSEIPDGSTVLMFNGSVGFELEL